MYLFFFFYLNDFETCTDTYWGWKWQPTLEFLPGKFHAKKVHGFAKKWTQLSDSACTRQ